MSTTVDKLPFSPNLFWDVNPAEVSMDEYPAYIVGRVLDYGQMNDWVCIRNYYGINRLRDIAIGIRSMFPQSLSFIATVTHTPEEQFRCYKLLQSKSPHWIY